MILKAIKMVTKRFEITFTEPVTQREFAWFEATMVSDVFDMYGVDADMPECTMTNNGRIILVEGYETIYDLIKTLAEHEFIHDIGLIKEIVDYEPQYEEEEIYVSND